MKHIMSYGLAAVLMAASGSGSGGGLKEAPKVKDAPSASGDQQAFNPSPPAPQTDAPVPMGTGTHIGGNVGNKDAPEFHTEILGALAKLKHNEDADWQEDGKPSLKRIVALAGNDQIKRKHVDAVAPDFEREKVLAEKEATSAAAIAKDKDEDAAPQLVNARVRALQLGQYGGRLYDAGEEFTYTGPLGRWFIKLKDKATAKDHEQDG